MFPGIDTTTITEELRERLSEELDYELEAKNQKYFAAHFEDHPFIHVPPILDEYSSRRVMTSELVAGSTFAELLTWSQEEKNLAAETLFRFTFGSIYRLAAFNGDPHPGNYIFHGGGRITFLDFGLVKHFSADDTALFESLITNMVVERDDAAFRRTIEDAGLLTQIDELRNLLGGIDDATANTLHAPYTWSLKQVVGHLIDNEAIFGYRARCFSTGDQTDLPGYEQDDYVANVNYSHVPMGDLLDEFASYRKAFVLMINRMTDEMILHSGVADGKRISVRAIAYLQVGHVNHHFEIMKQRLAG